MAELSEWEVLAQAGDWPEGRFRNEGLALHEVRAIRRLRDLRDATEQLEIATVSPDATRSFVLDDVQARRLLALLQAVYPAG